MKHATFHFGLYREGMKQLSGPGILLTMLLSLIALSPPSERILDYLEDFEYYVKTGYPEVPLKVGFEDLFPDAQRLMLLVAPILVFLAFRFVFRREETDFYLSIPVSRRSLLVTMLWVALSWTVIVLAVQTAFTLGLYAIFPHLYRVDYGDVLLKMGGHLLLNLRTAAVMAMACVFCGTTVMTVIMAVFLQYLPIYFFEKQLSFYHDLLTWLSQPVPKGAYAVESNLKAVQSWDYFLKSGELSVERVVFAALVGIVFVVVAIATFRFWKGETAGRTAVSSKVLTVMQIGASLMVMWQLKYDVLIFLLWALFAYLAIGFLALGKWKRVLRTLKWYPLAIAVCLLPYATAGLLLGMGYIG